MLFGLFKTVLYEKYIILYLTQRVRQCGGSNSFCFFLWKIRQSEQSGFPLEMIGFGLIILINLPPTLVMRTQQIQISHIHNLQNQLVFLLAMIFCKTVQKMIASINFFSNFYIRSQFKNPSIRIRRFFCKSDFEKYYVNS